ncbi:type I restriction-modification enzyme R subunit C-terminal domain-containing protein [Methanotrichaceae archaeon M04Ac]|uniref:Type I restriction-modification enzyme R subunit C-terminal domain-containing protein n=1 Tax=Candidatus Methanocrinis alkalitolerans TaxID=3033395 RepID=A0ABT5XBL3_9EURY|nr:type I restriction-modification enzyme R subunit C-terminal domain-containing protein [Candidatus Methanocrinis alkalitolerans]MDF0592100.1 type I restriction-modification enzyme R subunit C-terminal domain-containing protein [Candidatus Methanocrinis alkalitolerans]
MRVIETALEDPGGRPEEKARRKIDRLLEDAGWAVQDRDNFDPRASRGIAVREFPLDTGSADYLLFVDRQVVGVIEAKPEGTTLSGVSDQSQKYLDGIPARLLQGKPAAFAYEATGTETYFRDVRDPHPRSRRIFSFHRPETLAAWLSREDTLRSRLRNMPPLNQGNLRDCQFEAIQGLEASFAGDRPRALIQMATGAGKTFAAVTSVYRLIKFCDAKRILFLVDRRTLGEQALKEFQSYVTPYDGRKFTELYNVQLLKSHALDDVSKVCITTIQRLYSILRGEAEFDPDLEEVSYFDAPYIPERPVDVAYNPNIPIEYFDFVVVDECHRSIYNLWRQVLEYFDAYIVGMTATPSKQTLGFFHKNIVSEYDHERAVVDGVNVGYEVYRIRTRITEEGGRVEAGHQVGKRDKLTREQRWELIDEEFEYDGKKLDRDVVAPDQIRTIIRTFREKLFTEIFPGRSEVPKTLIFAKNDSHAEDIVNIAREEFDRGNEFCKKVTYRTTGEKPEDLIAKFRNSYYPRIAVTVDMISTGTDIRPLECLIFMRDVKSRGYFEQMKGRGTRTISPTDFKAVTPDETYKTHFVIVDAVGVCDSEKGDGGTLERKKGTSFDKLLDEVVHGIRDDDTLTTLASRLARLDRKVDEKDRATIEEVSNGLSLREMANRLLDAVDPDAQRSEAQVIFGTDNPTPDQIEEATRKLVERACDPFDDPKLRNTIKEIKTKHEQIIDEANIDEILSSGYDAKAQEKAHTMVETFQKFIEDNKDEITALQIFYSKPYGDRHLALKQIKELAEAIEKPPLHFTPSRLWQAYEQLERSKVKGAGAKKLLTDIISLLRFATGESEILEPFTETVNLRFQRWLDLQDRDFTPEQREWLEMIKNHISTSLGFDEDDFDYTPFQERGGLLRARQVFGDELDTIMDELNGALAI